MRQFFAILKDSFREAVDGFVIYLMLALSLILIVLVASVSYTPDPPDQALPEVVETFNVIYPDRGESRAPTGVPGRIDFKVKDAVRTAEGGVSFVLGVGEHSLDPPDKKREEKPKADRPAGPDLFRFAVVAWKSPAGDKIKDPRARNRNRRANKGGEPEMEIVMPPNATPDDLTRVTDEEMAGFLKSQFALFVGVREANVGVTRRPGVAEPDYQFDVTLKDVSGARGWPHSIHVLYGAGGPYRVGPLGVALYVIQDKIVNGLGAGVTLIIAVVITAFFIPNLLRKGSVDLLISKPIGRSQLLVYKYIGGLIFIFLLSGVTISGVWLVMAARSGYWDPAFLLVIPAITFSFAILYAVSTVVAVFTRSAIASIIVTLGFMFVMWAFGTLVKGFFDMNKVSRDVDLPEWSYTLVDTVNNVLPRYKDLDKLTTKLNADANLPTGLARMLGVFTEFPSFAGAVGVSLAFIAVMLAISCWRFSRRDY